MEQQPRASTASEETATHDSRSTNATEDPTAERVDRILGFLKTVEEDDAKSVATIQTNPGAMWGLKSMSLAAQADNSKPGPNTSAVFDGVKAKIMGQQLEIEEKTRTLALLKKEVKKLKEFIEEQAMQHKKDIKSKLNLQKKEYETMIKRHHTHMEKLLAEKEDLSQKCGALTEEVKALRKQFEDKMKFSEQEHARDIRQQRELWQAAEKVKREQWVQEQTKKIKDSTVKGMEPHIQQMLAQQKMQISRMEEKFREDLIREKGVLMEQQQRLMDGMRDRIVAERQKACEEEREFARQRYQKQLERDEMEFQQQKRKLIAEFEDQKHMLMETLKEEKKIAEGSHRKAVDDLRHQVEEERTAKDNALEELRRRHNTELSKLREKFNIEKEEWQTQFMAKQENEMRNREKSFKEKLIKERDTEIEMIIQRLELETSSNSSDATRRYRMEVEKLKAEMAEEVKQLRDQHSLALDKILNMQRTQAAADEKIRELQKQKMQAEHEVKTKDNLIQQQKEELRRLKVDEKTLSETIRCEFNEQLEAKDSAIQALSEQVSCHNENTATLTRKLRFEMEEMAKQKDQAMNLIEERVRKTIMAKDEILGSLRTQVEDLTIRNTHLERLIEQQRSELLS
ncbi:Centrosomal protein of 131 kDa [Rhizophlyctis rosea]|uniref:Centrosomal protein of 131 kDa n=1 Tax=Rhizophlyctis rosea TaxID=64517 RepID=A0AAD5SFR0_9FUNG|nr:Centrosomal protein of 131 kDa [Rhizophlyctis rosea]